MIRPSPAISSGSSEQPQAAHGKALEAPRRDLLGFTADVFSRFLAGRVGHAATQHRLLYRHLTRTGRFAPDEVPEWRMAMAASPGLHGRLAALAETVQVPDIGRVERIESPEHGPTRKAVIRTGDGLAVESVLIPMRAGAHHTICVSSQVGCKMGCGFCHTATMGLIRNLEAHEIVGQVAAVAAHAGIAPRNVVFMGMGEPFDNAEAVARAVAVLRDPSGFAIAPRHITISTVGRIDGLRRWTELGLTGINPAISLTAADDELRSQLMPINRTMPLAELRTALAGLPLPRSGRILAAVVVIPGVTDTPAAIARLAAFASGLPLLINLIPFNPIPSRSWRAPTAAEVISMRQALDRAGLVVRTRTTKGEQAMAACGQLGDPALRRRRPAV